jgi:Cell division protein CrgA
MGKPPKHRVPNSRVTEKGTHPASEGRVSSSGYVPGKISPVWIAPLMFGLLGLGALTIILNYVALVPGGTSNWYLLGGLGMILAGIITATQLH